MGETGSEGRDTLSIRDNRTGREYEIDVLEGDVIRSMDLRQIKVKDSDFGMMTYDPAFSNTASTRSTITYIDGGKGILRYRGYPIEQLAEQSTYLEVAYLLLKGELPTESQLSDFVQEVTFHTYVHENIKELLGGFRYDAHTMGMVISGIAALSTFYPDADAVGDPDVRWQQIVRLIAKMPTMAAYAYRHHRGLPLVYPENELSYTANFHSMLFRVGTKEYMLNRIGSVDNIPDFMEGVRRKEERLMGFGHRVYKAYDPRASIIKRTADEVFEVTGRNPLIEIALELEKIALNEEYFVERNLYPNVDFYSGIIYQAMGFPVEMFPVLFAIPRAVGWLSQWQEMLEDPEQRIARPRQIFLGDDARDFVPIADRG